MSEIRKDPISHTWVIISTERAKRPSDYIKNAAKEEDNQIAESCPLCQEAAVPPLPSDPWAGLQEEKNSQWLTRVLPNKFPALKPAVALSQKEENSFYHSLSGTGGHEIILDSLNHRENLSSMKLSQIEAMLLTYQTRFFRWKLDHRISYVLIFKNYKRAAGASLSHPHSQVIASPIIPPRIFEELREAREYYKLQRECIFCRMIKDELKLKKRLIYQNSSILIFSPYASRFPFETYIIPKKHFASLEETDRETIKNLAKAFKFLFVQLSKLLNDPPFNYMLHVSPLKTPGLLYYHWHFEVIPRLAMPAGYEFGSGIFINPTPPEEAARLLSAKK